MNGLANANIDLINASALITNKTPIFTTFARIII